MFDDVEHDDHLVLPLGVLEGVEDRRFLDNKADGLGDPNLLSIQVDPLELLLSFLLQKVQELTATAADVENFAVAVAGQPVSGPPFVIGAAELVQAANVVSAFVMVPLGLLLIEGIAVRIHE
jgi:hypothetical protein